MSTATISRRKTVLKRNLPSPVYQKMPSLKMALNHQTPGRTLSAPRAMMTRQPSLRCGKEPDGASSLAALRLWPPGVDGAGFALAGKLTVSPGLCGCPTGSMNNSRVIIFRVVAWYRHFRVTWQVNLALMAATVWTRKALTPRTGDWRSSVLLVRLSHLPKSHQLPPKKLTPSPPPATLRFPVGLKPKLALTRRATFRVPTTVVINLTKRTRKRIATPTALIPPQTLNRIWH